MEGPSVENSEAPPAQSDAAGAELPTESAGKRSREPEDEPLDADRAKKQRLDIGLRPNAVVEAGKRFAMIICLTMQ